MPSNVNTLDYWDNCFGSGDREAKGGYSQTRAFALSQIFDCAGDAESKA